MGSKVFCWVAAVLIIGIIVSWVAPFIIHELFGRPTHVKSDYYSEVGRITNIGTCDHRCKTEVVRPNGDLEYWTVDGNVIINMPVYRLCWVEDGAVWCRSNAQSYSSSKVPTNKIEKFPKPIIINGDCPECGDDNTDNSYIDNTTTSNY